MLKFFVIVLFGSMVGTVIAALKSPTGDLIPTAVAALVAAMFMAVLLESKKQSKGRHSSS